MARRKAGLKVATNGGGGGSARPKGAKIVMDVNPDAPNFYVNHMEVSHTAHDFSLAMVQMPAKLSAEQSSAASASGNVHFVPALYVTFPATLMPGLLTALSTQRAAYEKDVGPIRENVSGGKKSK
jgi:hypothetical protein